MNKRLFISFYFRLGEAVRLRKGQGLGSSPTCRMLTSQFTVFLFKRRVKNYPIAFVLIKIMGEISR